MLFWFHFSAATPLSPLLCCRRCRLRCFNCVFPHYKQKWWRLSVQLLFSRTALISAGLILLNTKLETQTNQNFWHVSWKEIQKPQHKEARLHIPSAKAVPHQYLAFPYWKIFNFFGLRQIKPNKHHSRNHYNHLLHGRNLGKPWKI